MPGFASQILNQKLPFSYSNFYLVELSRPGFGTAAILPIEIESITAPGLGITPMDAPLQGWRYSVKFPIGLAFEDITLNLRLTEDFYLYDFFEGWMNSVVNPDTYKLNYADKYEGTCTIHILNRKREKIKSRTYEGVYPIALGEISLNSTSANQVTPLAVTLTYT